MRSKGTKWSSEEISLLKKNYPLLKSKTKIAGRSRGGIFHQAKKHGLTTYFPKRWDKKEISLLENNKYKSNADILHLFPNRTEIALANARINYDIVKTNRWTTEEINILKENFGLKGSSIPLLLKRHSRGSVHTKAKALGIKYKRSKL